MTVHRITLNDNDWAFKPCDGQEWSNARVPGCVHTELLRNGAIPAPFHGTNEQELQWIDKKDWEYETRFDVSEAFLRLSRNGRLCQR